MRSVPAWVVASLICLLPGVAAAEWAVAFGTNAGGTWAVGTSWDADSRPKAENEALRACFGRAAADAQCRIIFRGENGCVAFATSGRDGWGTARRTSDGEARTAAVYNCQKANAGQSCYVRQAFCDRTGSFTPAEGGEDSQPIVPRTPPGGSRYPLCSNWAFWNECRSRCNNAGCVARCKESLERDVGPCRAD